MFTGLVEEIGTVLSLKQRETVAEIAIRAQAVLEGVAVGDSIAIAGVCLTVTAFDARSFTVQAVRETLGRTTIGTFRPGKHVNLEHALKAGDRLGGHFVQGHVDGIGTIASIVPVGDGKDFRIAIPGELSNFLVEKGSVAIDGISLTVTAMNPGNFGISVIPHTLSTTTLGGNRVGDTVNIETDILAKYIEKFSRQRDGITEESLRRLGYT